MSGGSRTRITLEQRRLMLEFMKSNPSVASGRFDGPEGLQLRSRLLKEMANILNSQRSGATKSSEKWLRSWQDWKSDTKRKAAKIIRPPRGHSNDQPTSGLTLTELEKDLIELVKAKSNNRHKEPNAIKDCRQLAQDSKSLDAEELLPSKVEPAEIEVVVSTSNLIQTVVEGDDDNTIKENKKTDSIEDKIASAMERQADSNFEVARQIGKLADVGLLFLKTWANFNNMKAEDLNI